MRRFLRTRAISASGLAGLLLLGLLAPQAALASPTPATHAVDPLVAEMLAKVDRWTMHTIDYDLQNISQPDRAIASTRNVKATDFIVNHLTVLGLQIEKHAFTYQGLTRHNIVGTLPGTDNTSKEIYATGGHMDTVPNSPGANDDGTGATAAIHMAQIMSGYRFKHTIKFGLWNGEEVGLVGSSKWAAKAKQEAQDIRLYVGMDMVGFSGKSAKEMWMYSNTQSDAVRATATQLNTDYAIGADLTTQNCDCRNTDHKAFWNQGFTAVGTASEQTAAMDPTYHKPTDTVSHAMFDNLAVTTSVNLALLATSAVPVGKAQAIDRIEVTPPTSTITADQTQQLSAKAYDSANQQVNATFAWAASGGAVDQSGSFAPASVGAYTVYANASGKSGSATVTVTPGQLASIIVSPPTATVPVSQTQQFTAKGEDAKKNPVSVSPQWAVDGGGTVDGAGLFTAASQGLWKIYANSSSVSGAATVQVTGGGGGGVASISVEPAQVTLRSDQTAQFKAIGRDASGNSLGEVSASWTAENGNIDSSGLFDPQKTGTWKVTAAYQQITGTASVTVTPGPIASLGIEPKQATLKVGEKRKYTTFANDSEGNAIAGAAVTFITEPKLGDFSSDGTFTAKTAGSGKVKATATYLGGSSQAEADLTVSGTPPDDQTPPASVFAQPLFLVGIIAAVIAVGAIAALLAVRRRKKSQMSQAQGPWGQQDWGGPPQ